MGRIIAISNQKGGTAKTCSSINLGVGLARKGYRVLLVDADPQASMTAALGFEPDENRETLSEVLMSVINEEELQPEEVILHQDEGVDLIAANIELSGLEVSLVNVMSRETLLRSYLDALRDEYDYILIDCMPSLGMLTINALTAADSVIIPVQAAYLPVKGLMQLISTINKVRKQLNRNLCIDGILLTMVDFRTNYAKDISTVVRETYGGMIKIFDTVIPLSVKAAECTSVGESIYKYDARGKVAAAYMTVIDEMVRG